MDRKILEHYCERFNKQEGRREPCSNQTVVCLIATKDQEKAEKFILNCGIEVIEKQICMGRINWYLANGERWVWHRLNDSTRGYRYYKAAVDENIDMETFRLFVLPGCDLYCCHMEVI